MLWWIPLIVAAAGMAAKAKQDRDVRKTQEGLSNQMADLNARRAKKSTDVIEQFLSKQAPEARQAETRDIREELTGGLRSSVDEVRRFEQPETISGRVSSDYGRIRAAGAGAAEQRVSDAISRLAVIGSPYERGTREALRYGEAGTEVDASNRYINNMTGAYQNAIGGVRTNDFNRLAADLTGAAGMAMASMGGSGGGAKPGTRPPAKGKLPIYSG
jgi:hypothetical protein